MNYEFKVRGMHCVSCAMIIEEEAEEMEGVHEAKADFKKNTLKVETEENFNINKLFEKLSALGYELEEA